MTEIFKQRFKELKTVGQRSAANGRQLQKYDAELITFLQNALSNGDLNTFEEKGFALWNISDSLALLRQTEKLYVNHKCFYGLLKTAHPKYLFWAVSDATQRLTLEVGGHGRLWWSIYNEANGDLLESRELFAEFSAHKAAMYTTATVPFEKADILSAADRFEQFLSRTEGMLEHIFYISVFKSLGAKHGFSSKQELTDLFDGLLGGLSHKKEPKRFLVGEWSSFTAPPCKRTQSEQGITAIINALLDISCPDTANELYQTALKNGLPKNGYIERRIAKVVK